MPQTNGSEYAIPTADWIMLEQRDAAILKCDHFPFIQTFSLLVFGVHFMLSQLLCVFASIAAHDSEVGPRRFNFSLFPFAGAT